VFGIVSKDVEVQVAINPPLFVQRSYAWPATVQVIVAIPTNSRPYLLERALQTVDRRADQLRRDDPETVSESGNRAARSAECGQICVKQVAGTNKSIILLPLCGANPPHCSPTCSTPLRNPLYNAALTT
jgi:hypothetical protein